jgi:aromatic ring-opening dioxygenase LigB subunit
MPLVYAGVCSHGPGITSRAERADPQLRDAFFENYSAMAAAIRAANADVIVFVAAEHFANFFMNNMPAFAMGMADTYSGPVEDAKWLGIPERKVPGNRDLSERLIKRVMNDVDVAFAEEWQFDHGVMVPLHFLSPENDIPVIPCNINCQGPPLTPLHRVWAFGEALRAACDEQSERIAIVGTGGISHWPATPDSGKINEEWDREFMRRWSGNDKEALISYTDAEIYKEAGQGGFEIRTFVAIAAAARGQGNIHFLEPIPIFATSACVASMDIAS